MPVPDSQTFTRMLEACVEGKHALASINVTSSNTVNAALAAFAESKTDGILQISTGGGEHASGPCKNMALGAIALAEYIHRLAEHLDVYIAITTDHCVPAKVQTFLQPLVMEAKRRKEAGLKCLFNCHMFDGSELPMKENMEIAQGLLCELAAAGVYLEVEAGLVGGEEDGIDNSDTDHSKLFTTPEDMVYVYEQLHNFGLFTLAATFGNVHGVYKPGNVKLNPKILKDGNDAVVTKYGDKARHKLVFHGGSGSELGEIHETLDYGVVKMNVDTDCQYHFSRPIADHMLKNYDGVLRVDGEMGDKKAYDPRSYMKKAEKGMKERVLQAATELRSLGKSMYKG